MTAVRKLSKKAIANQRAASRRYYEDNKDAIRVRWLMNRYGLTPEQYQAMWDEQDERCAICGEPFETTKDTRIDHDHSCCNGVTSCGNCVRGLLCHRCNTGLGYFRDNPVILASAIEYLGTTVV